MECIFTKILSNLRRDESVHGEAKPNLRQFLSGFEEKLRWKKWTAGNGRNFKLNDNSSLG